MAENATPVVLRMKKALTKLTAFVRLCHVFRPPSRRMRSFDSDGRTAGLRSILGDESIVEKCSVRKLERGESSRNGSCEDDVDQRAQIFIDNFRRQLMLERQISLKLMYYGINSSEIDYEARSPPFSSSIR
ncbi:hypothetical protein SDJN03_25333, partial [Cucurbita argyrosperma subsp. sororia]